jgi:hypothetical protein
MDPDKNPFLIIDAIARLMPAAIDEAWRRMRKQIERERTETQAIVEHHCKAPSSETLHGLRETLEKHRELARTATQQRNHLAQMVDEQRKSVGYLEQKATRAQKRGDADLANDLQRERDSYQKSLELTLSNLIHAEETLVQIKQMLERWEERLRREEERIQNIERERLSAESNSVTFPLSEGKTHTPSESSDE